MAWNERRRGLDGPIAFGSMKVGMAHATGHDLHEDFARPGYGHRYTLDPQWPSELMHNGSFH